MNLKKAKSLRRLSEQIFLLHKSNGDENYKDLNPGENRWYEQTSPANFKNVPDYELQAVLDENGNPKLNNAGNPVHQWVEKLDEEGKQILKNQQVTSGVIKVHPACERGLYKRLKKIYYKDPKNFMKKFIKSVEVTK